MDNSEAPAALRWVSDLGARYLGRVEARDPDFVLGDSSLDSGSSLSISSFTFAPLSRGSKGTKKKAAQGFAQRAPPLPGPPFCSLLVAVVGG